jgi:hypothetical protein
MTSKQHRRRLVFGPEPGKNGRTKTGWYWGGPSAALPSLALALVATAIVLIAAVVDGNGRPFPYLAGQRAEHAIRLSETLRLANEAKTRQRQEEAAASAPVVFRRDDRFVGELTQRFQELLNQVSTKQEFSQLDARLRTSWGLNNQQFGELRTLVGKPNSVGQVSGQIARVFEQTIGVGILDPNFSIEEQFTGLERNLEIVPSSSEGESRFVREEDVRLSAYANPKGVLARRLELELGKPGITVFSLAVPRLRPTLEYNAVRTRENRDTRWQQVVPVVDTINRGTLIVEQGALITEDALRLLREEHRLIRPRWSWQAQPERLIAMVALVLGVMLAAWVALRIYRPRVASARYFALHLCGTVLAAVVLARLLRSPPYHAEALPVAIAALLWTVTYDRLIGLVLASVLSLFVGLMSSVPMSTFLLLLGGTVPAVLALDSVRSRTMLMKVGALSAVGFGLVALILGGITNQPLVLTCSQAAWHAGMGIVVGFFLSGVLPFIEQVFGVVTDISLKELADSNHPLLKELARRAPGTFNHSVTVSIFGEAAAKAINADAEVVRVGALFHDIGKMNKPLYFIENKSPEDRNRHELLAPAMSTLVIIGHVRDGLDLGQQFHLPRPILDMIEQHHGTTRIDYFYHEAERAARAQEVPDEEVEESAFRYPGPKPQTREAAVLMLTDCVESASRTLSEPTPGRIRRLIQDLAMHRLLDGQFDESGLTLQDLALIQASLVKSVTAHYHARVKYPSAARVAE